MTWQSLGIPQAPEQQKIKNNITHPQQDNLWSSLGMTEEKPGNEILSEESVPENATRNIVRGAYKAGVEAPIETVESLASLTKSISPIENIMNLVGTTKLTPEQLNEVKQRISKYNIPTPITGLSQPGEFSEKLRETVEKASKGYLKPQGEKEESFDNAVKMASSSLFGQPFTKSNVVRGLIGGFGGEVAGKAVASLAGGEGLSSEVARMAPMFLAQAIRPGEGKQLGEKYYEKARKNLPKGAIGDASGFQKELDNLIVKWKRGGSTFDKKKAIQEAEQIVSKIRDGTLEFEEAMELKADLNKNQAVLYKEQGASNAGIRDAREKIGKVRSSLKKFIAKSNDVYPEFYSNYLKGEEIHSAIENSKFISKWIKDKFPMLGNDTYLKTALGIGEAALTKLSPQTALVGATALGANEARALISQMKNSPVLRKHYFDVIKNAMNQNAAAFLNSYKRFRNEIDKETEY